MDLRRWHWSSPWAKRSHLVCCCVLLFLGLINLQQVKASDTSYQQESKNEVPDTNKLDSLSNFLPYDSREDSEYKRASAFFPLRGKKPSEEDSLRAQQSFDLNQGEDKRAQFFPLRGKKVPDDLKRASYFMPMRGRKDGRWTEEDYDVTDESPNKRASSFMPMRGKKKYASISEYLSKTGTYSNDVNPSDSESQNSDKRMHSFVPVRGKRSMKEMVPYMNDSESQHESFYLINPQKKRSSSFMPMRGRRDFEDPNWSSAGIATTLVEKKKQSFMPMRGKKESEEIDKKAAGFLPMRDRKNVDEMQSEKEEFESSKRAQSFMPMRGRRTELHNAEFGATPEIKSVLINDKRASSFMPMRGKRDVSEDTKHKSDHVKKSSSFMPMRGKRSILEAENNRKSQANSDSDKNIAFASKTNVESGNDFEVKPWQVDQLYSLLDKKSSSFMPMRGRRYFDEDSTVAPWQPDQLISLFNKKSTFMPMRGRRYFDEDSTVAPWQPDQLMSLFNKKSAFMPMRGRRYFDEDSTVAPWQPDQLMSLFNKKSAFLPMRGRRYFDEDSTVAPWQADQLMSLLDKKSAFMPMQGRRYVDEDFTVAPWQADQLMSLLDKKSEFPLSGNEQRNSSEESSLLESRNKVDGDDKNAADKRSSSFMPMRGRRLEDEAYFYNPYTYLMAGMGSSLMSKPYSNRDVYFTSTRSPEARKKKIRINWDSVKRAFHATRGKRFEDMDDVVDSLRDSFPNGSHELSDQSFKESEQQTRSKRSIIRPRVSVQPIRQYIALKRPMSFFATRGKRMDESGIDTHSKLR